MIIFHEDKARVSAQSLHVQYAFKGAVKGLAALLETLILIYRRILLPVGNGCPMKHNCSLLKLMIR